MQSPFSAIVGLVVRGCPNDEGAVTKAQVTASGFPSTPHSVKSKAERCFFSWWCHCHQLSGDKSGICLHSLSCRSRSSDCLFNLQWGGCPLTPAYPEPSSKLRKVHASFKYSMLERKTGPVIYVNVKFPIITDRSYLDSSFPPSWCSRITSSRCLALLWAPRCFKVASSLRGL